MIHKLICRSCENGSINRHWPGTFFHSFITSPLLYISQNCLSYKTRVLLEHFSNTSDLFWVEKSVSFWNKETRVWFLGNANASRIFRESKWSCWKTFEKNSQRFRFSNNRIFIYFCNLKQRFWYKMISKYHMISSDTQLKTTKTKERKLKTHLQNHSGYVGDWNRI